MENWAQSLGILYMYAYCMRYQLLYNISNIIYFCFCVFRVCAMDNRSGLDSFIVLDAEKCIACSLRQNAKKVHTKFHAARIIIIIITELKTEDGSRMMGAEAKCFSMELFCVRWMLYVLSGPLKEFLRSSRLSNHASKEDI